jgi:arsenate reductase-like glutaredoxin family protein
MDVKPIADFHNSSVSKTGYATRCKSCKSAKHFANKDKINAAQRKYRAENRDEVLSKENAWREANAEKVLNNREKYLREHKGERAALQNKRRAAKINATPSWADEAYIKDLYVNCREAEVVFERAGISVKFEVDHILPLQGKSVCGLHMEANLQILTAAENAQKHNCIT